MAHLQGRLVLAVLWSTVVFPANSKDPITSILRLVPEHMSPRHFICSDINFPKGQIIHKIVRDRQINRKMFTGGIQVGIRGTGCSGAHSWAVRELDLDWGLRRLCPLMQKEL